MKQLFILKVRGKVLLLHQLPLSQFMEQFFIPFRQDLHHPEHLLKNGGNTEVPEAPPESSKLLLGSIPDDSPLQLFLTPVAKPQSQILMHCPLGAVSAPDHLLEEVIILTLLMMTFTSWLDLSIIPVPVLQEVPVPWAFPDLYIVPGHHLCYQPVPD